MKTTWKIAKAELYNLFCSPIAWLILIIFAFQAGLTFSDLIDDQLRYLALGYRPYNLTSRLLLGFGGVFAAMQDNLYLYIPLLTMGLMSKEYSSGSIKLLYSSPVTNTQIILGKYLSMLVYALLLIAVLLLFLVFCALTVEHFDYPFAFTGLLGILLLTCAYAAIGLFMSTLTAYQVVAAVGTLTLLALLNYIGNVGQDIAFVRDITYWLSLSGRSDSLIEGMICSQDVLYFFIVIVLFLVLSILKLKFARTSVKPAVKWMQYTLTVCVALLVGYTTTRPKLMGYYDATATKANTLTPESQEVMKQLTGGLTITTYVNLLDECWKMCEKFHTNIVIMYDHVSCKNVGGLHGLFEDQARERGIHLIWIPHDVMDPRTVSRREMREAFSQYMVTVLNEKPLDPTLLDYEDALSW